MSYSVFGLKGAFSDFKRLIFFLVQKNFSRFDGAPGSRVTPSMVSQEINSKETFESTSLSVFTHGLSGSTDKRLYSFENRESIFERISILETKIGNFIRRSL